MECHIGRRDANGLFLEQLVMIIKSLIVIVGSVVLFTMAISKQDVRGCVKPTVMSITWYGDC